MASTIVEIPQEVLETFAKSDHYHSSFLVRPDEGLEHALKNNVANGLPDISVSASLGKFLKLTALAIGAKRVLEVGTLGGYSTIWMGQALPEDGELIALEISEVNAKVARENLAGAGIRNARVVVGDAKETLASLPTEEQFDLVFIDADKGSYPTYLLEAKRLVRKHGVIIVDNFVQLGRVADESFSRPPTNRPFEYPTDTTVEGVRMVLRILKEDKEVEATTIAVADMKGYDGFLYAIKL
ncbi:O-methyltransferase-domain-containing protein [Pisolithus croceorrhizus]|nr:O-methyltransferase-domain-containing protein [Pisolithus croceorrhizus]KAI6138216.1 O-methyltransferase-domain-containing protein [Pisolithus thermaeus]